MQHNSEHRVVLISTDSYENAKHISRILVTEKLAACCTVLQNVISLFAWESALQERYESMIIVKTSKDRLEDHENRVLQIHTDEVPEIVALPVTEGSESYLSWINQVLQY